MLTLPLTLYLTWVTKTGFLLTISIQYQSDKLWEYLFWIFFRLGKPKNSLLFVFQQTEISQFSRIPRYSVEQRERRGRTRSSSERSHGHKILAWRFFNAQRAFLWVFFSEQEEPMNFLWFKSWLFAFLNCSYELDLWYPAETTVFFSYDVLKLSWVAT